MPVLLDRCTASPTRLIWGVGILAVVQLERADAGLGEYPRIPFGTRGMLVISPAPRSSWTPRAEPCAIFGAGDSVPDSYLVYQKGWIKSRTDVQPQGLSQDDLCWVKINMANWDPPDRPLDLPDPADYDAAALSEARPRNIPAATLGFAPASRAFRLARVGGRRNPTVSSGGSA